jgi:acetyl esterase/lipase
VIIAPGGGFRVLAIDQEGYSVAEWFSQRGITAFVLKYRLAFTPGTDQEFAPNLSSPPIPRTADGAPPRGAPGPNALPEEAQKNGIADGIQALKLVRANAAKWGIAPIRSCLSASPPAFLAVAEDDPIAAGPVLKFLDALRAAKLAPELHVFRSGQHGFSMLPRNGTSDHWIEELY